MIHNAQCATKNKLSYCLSNLDLPYSNCFLVNYIFTIFIISVILQRIFLSCPLSCCRQFSSRYMHTMSYKRTLQEILYLNIIVLNVILQLTSCGAGSISDNGSFHNQIFLFFFFSVLFCIYFLGTASIFCPALEKHGFPTTRVQRSSTLFFYFTASSSVAFLSNENTFKT